MSIYAKEIYANETVLLWSCEQTPGGKIGPGTFDLPFQLVIPSTCLGSFKGSYGSISYALHVYIKTGLPYYYFKMVVPIIVQRIEVININLPRLMVPTQKSAQKKLVGFSSFGGKIEFTASLSRTGFYVGHNLPLTVSVVNGSSRQIKMRVSIKRICTYRAYNQEKSERIKLVTIVSPNIAAHSLYTWNVEDLIVPMVAPEPTFRGMIELQYVLKVTAVIPWDFNSSVSIPITLGNVQSS